MRQVFGVAMVCVWGAMARAQAMGVLAEDAPALTAEARITLSAEVGAWYVAPGGDITFGRSGPGSSTQVVANDLAMDSPKVSPSIELNVGNGRWGGTVRAATFSSVGRDFTAGAAWQLGDTLLNTGDAATTSLDFTMLEVEARYSVYPRWRDGVGTRETRPWQDFDRSVDVVVGARLVDVDLEVTRLVSGVVTPVAAFSGTYAMPTVGVKAAMYIEDDWTLDATTTFGGWLGARDSFAWDVMVGFQWHPEPNVGLQVGYRQLLHRLGEDGSEAQWDGAMAGFYVTLVARF